MMQVALLGVALFAFDSIGERAGPFGSACLSEICLAAIGAAIGMLFSRPLQFALAGAFVAIPVAIFFYVVVEGIGC